MSSKSKFTFRSLINRTAEEAFGWHLRPRTVERTMPPGEPAKISSSDGRPDKKGSQFAIRDKVWGPFWQDIVLEYQDYIPNESFKVIQVKGPFKHWEYTTKITPQSEHTSEIVDHFEFSHNYPKVFNFWINRKFRKRFTHILNYKHELIDHDLSLLAKYPFEKPLKTLVSGSHGLIGKSLCHFLEFAGHEVWHLTRHMDENDPKQVPWNPQTGKVELADLEGFDAVYHLAGENIGKGLWTQKRKKELLDSRYRGTKNLVTLLSQLKSPPKAFICASAIGIYGSRGDEVLKEESHLGKDMFLSEVCQQWERAACELEEKGIRTVRTRFGMVLSSGGGALKRILLPFELGIGGKVGSGRQYMSWISIDDAVGALYHTLMTPTLKGAVNCVSPCPVTNGVFAQKLAQRLKRWQGPPVPALFIHMLLGQKGDELLLSSARAEPARLLETGYNFQYPKLMQALQHVI